MKKIVKKVLSLALFSLTFAVASAEEFKGQIMFNGSSSLAPVISKYLQIL